MHKIFSRNNFLIGLLILLVSSISGLALSFSPLQEKLFPKLIQNEQQPSQSREEESGQDVLGKRTPQIYVSGGKQGYSGGGMIALASTDEPAVNIGGYDVSGKVEVSVYEADEQALLDYLTHDKDGKQTKKNPDVNRFRFIKKVDHELKSSYGDGSKLLLPIGESGIYFLRIKQGSVSEDSFVVRSNIGAIVKEGDNEYVFWAQNFKNRRSLGEGSLSVYNLQDNLKEIGSTSFNSDGVARTNLTADADIALVRNAGDKAIIPINLMYLNSSYDYKPFQPKPKQTKYFIFTDRPLYRPGDTIYFKSVLRDDDDVRYTIPSGQAQVKVYDGYGEESLVFERNFGISGEGTVNGEYKLPANAKTGYYRLVVTIPGSTQSSTSFNVEFFRKPEYSVDVTTPKTELVAGDKSSFIINGSYFSGQPLANQKVKYRVYTGDFYEYEYLVDRSYILSDDYRYGYWGGDIFTQGEATLNQNGIAEIDLDTKIPQGKGRSQVFSIEAEFDDGSGNPSFSRKNVLVYAGEYDIYRKDTSYYSTKVNTQLSIPVTLVSHRNANVSGVNLTAKVHRENWVQYQDPNQKYPSYRKEEEDLPQLKATTDGSGNATFTFTPTKVGSYKISVEGNDGRGNTISKTFYSYVTSDDYPYYFGDQNNDLTIRTDKQKYLPTDTVTFTITSTTPDRDIFLSLERGRTNRFQIVKMSGKTVTVDVPLVNTDMPNIYAKVSSFSPSDLDSGSTNVVVSPDSKKLVVNVTPNRKTLGPSENVTINIETTDLGGNPVSADVAVWAVDKAIFELVDEKPEKIFETFWKERSNDTQESHSLEGITVYNAERGGGCFAAGTQVLMADGSTKAIEDVNVGDYVLTKENEKSPKLVKGKVIYAHESVVSGYLIINGDLKVTNNHKLWVNNSWKEAGSIQIGDTLIDRNGNSIEVSSVEWLNGKFTVYNLGVDKYNTYFADGIWVHNQKGSPRTIFKDTAYWNPSVHTDGSGRAQLSFKLPDNLTTWVVAAVGATVDTKVGQITNEVVVTKDVIVRPILPNILREGDEIILSALVQNFTEEDHTFDIDLKFDAGEVKSATQSGVLIKSKEMQQIYWNVSPKEDKDKAKLTFSARSQKDKNASDTIVQEIPVRAFGFSEQRAETGDGPKSFSVKLAEDSHPEKSTVTLSLAPTILGTLPSAMKYLVDYPYGCIEQTTSRFVPAVIAKANPDLFATALEGKDVNDMIDKGLSRLATHQQSDGGWAWWYSGRSDPFITAYVIEYVLQAKQAGINVDDDLLKRAQSYLEQERFYDSQSQQEKTFDKEGMIAKNYALTLLGAKDKVKRVNDLENLTPDLLSLAVMTNYLNGDKNSQTNGLAKLIAMAKSQGDGEFWEAGSKQNFASNDASTAFAIRAIVTAGGDRDLAVKGARYLTRNRKSNYWSNTFATAQVIRAVVDLTRTGDELSPGYTYTASLDNKEITRGAVINSRQLIKDVVIPVKDIKSNGSNISITKTGDGQIYSTLLINEFHIDRNAKAVEHGLKVTREYINDKGEQYTLAVGDTATVKITVSGLKANENYGVINDELPSGLIPINQSFKNQQYGQDPYNYYYYSYDVTDREVTENGMILSLYQISSGERTYTYKARVVNEGKFTVPPTTASLMYAPEIYGRSDVQTIEITKESKIIPGKVVKDTIGKFSKEKILAAVVILLILLGIGAFILKRRGVTFAQVKEKTKEKIKEIIEKLKKNRPGPPTSTPQSQGGNNVQNSG